MYSTVTANQISNGNHHNRAIGGLVRSLVFRIPEKTAVAESLSACMDKLMEANKLEEGFQEAHQRLLMEIEHMNLEKQLSDFDRSHNRFPMHRWARLYMRQVGTDEFREFTETV